MPADQIMAPHAEEVRTRALMRACTVSMSWTLSSIDRLAETAASLGFNHLLALAGTPADPAVEHAEYGRMAALTGAAHRHGLRASVALCLDRIASGHNLAARIAPAAFSAPPPEATLIVDPRLPVHPTDAVVHLRRPANEAAAAWWQDQLRRLHEGGVDDFAQIDAGISGLTFAALLGNQGETITAFTTLGESLTAATGNILITESGSSPDNAQRMRELAYTALLAEGWAVPAHVAADMPDLVRSINRLMADRGARPAQQVRYWTAPTDKLRVASRGDADRAVLLVHNRGTTVEAWPPAYLPPFPWQALTMAPGMEAGSDGVPPGAAWLLEATAAPPVAATNALIVQRAAEALRRVIISRMSPSVDGGAYAIKRVQGEWIDIEADIFADGHDLIAASVLTRAADETTWVRHQMVSKPNDVWVASIRFTRLGRHELVIEAWRDVWGNFTHDFELKHQAGQDLKLEIREAAAMIEAAAQRAPRTISADFAAFREKLAQTDQDGAATLLLSPDLSAAMASCDEQPFLARSFAQQVQVEREAARFSAWYELFPRSQAAEPGAHGTFADVIPHLPHIAGMGFDTLYFPPIHPIGRINRKGRNNTLTPSAEDVGSPYAIGSDLGGHDAIHPDLGSLEDFRDLLAAARDHGMEIALDFAIQCAPDHPWLKQHPGWFAWRPDGSIKYAENPPKKYQDIVNVDFYADDAVPDLWLALRDVVLHWADQGVMTFRVDNPHTKPLPFWQWMIAEVKAQHPEVLFLSEAFTRPKPMYHLAKVGFSQSYTYFTWRNSKAELEAYFTEVTKTGVREFFRPHLFVNTPDINPLFLQTAGRAGFLIRAALAATLSGLWGVYAGFELCESAALPGREEYLDSEKYEIRQRPARAPGDIVDEITQLNRLRRAEPALQNHLDLEFHNAFNDRIIYYSKAVPGQTDRLIIAVSLDPTHAQSADFEIPLWLFELPDSATIAVEDLLDHRHFTWSGKMQHMTLTPERPYAIWRITPPSQA